MTVYRFDDVRVDTGTYRVWKAERPVHLEPKAFEVLVLLAASGGRLLTKTEIQEAVWKDTFVTENAVARLIAQLRKALEDDAREAKYIETVATRGYRFLAAVRREEGPRTLPGPSTGTPPLGTWRRARAGAAILALASVAAGIWWRTSGRHASPAPGAKPHQASVTSSSGLDDFPSFSPDGGSLAFSSDRSGAFEVYVRALVPGARDVAVTSDGQGNTHPA